MDIFMDFPAFSFEPLKCDFKEPAVMSLYSAISDWWGPKIM